MPTGIYKHKSKSIKDKFWRKIKKTKSCWFWIGCKNNKGYGYICHKGKWIGTHRFMWFLIHGKWSKKQILHKCDNPSCVNPKHLFEGNQKNNTWDMIKKGRSKFGFVKGQISNNRKLTFQQAQEIRKKFKNRESIFKLEKIYGIKNPNLYKIIKNITYKK